MRKRGVALEVDGGLKVLREGLAVMSPTLWVVSVPGHCHGTRRPGPGMQDVCRSFQATLGLRVQVKVYLCHFFLSFFSSSCHPLLYFTHHPTFMKDLLFAGYYVPPWGINRCTVNSALSISSQSIAPKGGQPETPTCETHRGPVLGQLIENVDSSSKNHKNVDFDLPVFLSRDHVLCLLIVLYDLA